MKNIVKTFGFIGVMSVISAVFAAENSRIGIIGKTASRVPVTRRTSAVTSIADMLPKSDSYYSNAECVEKYTECIMGDDVCGPDMEECTTRVLFHAQMPKCISALSLCLDRDIVELFGTSKSNLSADAKYEDPKNPESAILDFKYPSDSSIVGQMILGAKVANQLDDSQCMKKYTSCIKKDNVCGEDFELCTENKYFQKQAIACNSVLARCKSTGKKELFGKDVEVTGSGSNLTPSNGSVLGQSITDGRELAAANAVSTCYKIADQCIVGVCTKSPFACIAGTTVEVADSAENAAPEKGLITFTRSLGKDARSALEMVRDNKNNTAGIASDTTGFTLSARDVRSFINSHCGDVIGSNKYCYATATGRQATDKKLQDPDVRDEVFEDIYNARMGSDTKAGFVKPRLQQIADDFDKEAKQKCSETISSCVMRSCGGGIGSVCYTQVFHGSEDKNATINKSKLYDKIKTACAPIVNTDANCQYAKAKANSNSYTYKYIDDDVFTTLFPEYKANESKDPIGVVASLNARLSSSYNDAAIAQMKKQCTNTVTSCVKSMCGTDYVKCYRNRNDIKSYDNYGTYSADGVGAKFASSMNKVGGVLDYNIVIGLCMDTVKNASTCEEHLKIAAADWLDSELDDPESVTSAWVDANTKNQYGSVREGWVAANTVSVTGNDPTNNGVVIGCTWNPNGGSGSADVCNDYTVMTCGFVDSATCRYDVPQYESYDEYALQNAGTTLFQEVLKDVEREVQAKYNAKLTQEHNVCLANNQGGIRGDKDTGSSFMWVKLNSNRKVPANYSIKGLSTKDFIPSNDLYGSFCRVRVTLQSDDKAVQEILSGDGAAESVGYFAVGDAFTCGSWLSEKILKKITDKVGDNAAIAAGKGGAKDQMAYAWSTVGGLLAGGALGTGLTESGTLGNALSNANMKNSSKLSRINSQKDRCIKYATDAKNELNGLSSSYTTAPENLTEKLNNANSYIDYAFQACDTLRTSINSDTSITNKNDLPSSCGTRKKVGYTTDGSGKTTVSDLKEARDGLEDLINNCEYIANFADGADDAKQTMRWAVPMVTSLAGAGLGAGIAASVLEAKYQGISDEAVKAWMEEVGDHIKCYVGTEELGSYGDIVNFNID